MDGQSVSLADSTLVAPPDSYGAVVQAALSNRRADLDAALHRFAGQWDTLARIASAVVSTLQSGGKVLVAGNGGSAAEAQHFAAELVGRFKLERRPYAALALTVDSSILTAIGNDYGFADVFARQVLALGSLGDLLLLYSTSGNSENLLRAATAAQQIGMTVAAITGDRPNPLEQLAVHSLRVPSTDTPVVQELQMIVTHILCEIAECELSREDGVVDA